MRMNFTNISAQERAKLFPVLLEKHNPKWKTAYLQEKQYLETVFGKKLVRINHIGSSSVKGLIAKPTVDILLEVQDDTDIAAITAILLEEGYVVNTPKTDLILFLKGYTPSGFQGQAFHIHVRHFGDWGELYFRDYLQAHLDIALQYGCLKQTLQKRYPYDRDGYTDAKGAFVEAYTTLARKAFPNRYTPLK